MEQNKNQYNQNQDPTVQKSKRPNRAVALLTAGIAVGALGVGAKMARDAGNSPHTTPLHEKTELTVTPKTTPATEAPLPVTPTTEAPAPAIPTQPAETAPAPAPAPEIPQISHESHQTHEQHIVTHQESPSNPADNLPPGATVYDGGAVATSSDNLTKNPDGTETLVVNGQVVPYQQDK